MKRMRTRKRALIAVMIAIVAIGGSGWAMAISEGRSRIEVDSASSIPLKTVETTVDKAVEPAPINTQATDATDGALVPTHYDGIGSAMVRFGSDGAASDPSGSRVQVARGTGGLIVNCPNGTSPTLDHIPTEAELIELCGLSRGSGGSGGGTQTLRCPDGSSRNLDHDPTLDEMKALCGIYATTTTTAPRLPKILGASIHAIDGLPDPGGSTGWLCIIPPDATWLTVPGTNWCPLDLPTRSRQFSWTAQYDNGVTLSGTTPLIAPGATWRTSPNDWNGSISIRVDATGGIGWGTGWN